MTRHVNHLLSEYVSGQLSIQISRRVEHHIQECARCRTQLAQHENIRHQLEHSLGSSHFALQTSSDALWYGIDSALAAPSERSYADLLAGKLLPVLASMIILAGIPMLIDSGTVKPPQGLEATHADAEAASQKKPVIVPTEEATVLVVESADTESPAVLEVATPDPTSQFVLVVSNSP